MLYVIVNLQTIPDNNRRLATLLKHLETLYLTTCHLIVTQLIFTVNIGGLPSVPGPKPIPAQIAFSIVCIVLTKKPKSI